jgi:hypothetical protein
MTTSTTSPASTPNLVVQARVLAVGDVVHRVHKRPAPEPVTVTDLTRTKYGVVRITGTTMTDPEPRVRWQGVAPLTDVSVYRADEDPEFPPLAVAARQFVNVWDADTLGIIAGHLQAVEADALAALVLAADADPSRAVELVASWVAQDDDWSEWADMPLRWAERYPDLWVGVVEFYSVPDLETLREAAEANRAAEAGRDVAM